MAIVNELRDPFRRKLYTTVAERAATAGQTVPSPTAAPGVGAAGNSDIPVSEELNISGVTQGIRSEAEAIRQEGYQQVAALQKRRGTLISGQTARLDQKVAEQARLQAEGRLTDATLRLMELRQAERLAKLSSMTAIAGIETTGAETRETIGTQSAAELAAIRETGLQARETAGTQSGAALSAIKETGAQTRETVGTQSAAELAAIRAGGTEARLTAQGQMANQRILQREQVESAERIASGQQLTSLELGRMQRETAVRGYVSQESIANLQAAVARQGDESAERIAAATGLSAQTVARIQQDTAKLGYMSQQTIAGVQKDIAIAGNASAETVARWDAIEKSFGYDITTTQGAAGLQKFVAGTTLTAKDQKDIIVIQVAAQAQGYDLSTPGGRANFTSYLTAQTSKFQLSAVDQKAVAVAQIASQSGGFDLTQSGHPGTATTPGGGRIGYREWLDKQATTYKLSVEDQKKIAIGQIASSAAGYDLTTPEGRKGYETYLYWNADKFQLTADEQEQLATSQLAESGRQFDLTRKDDWDKFLRTTEQTAEQFNISQINQMAVVRAQLENSLKMANAEANFKSLEALSDILSDPAVAAAFDPNELAIFAKRALSIVMVKDPISGVMVPEAALVAGPGGDSPASRARAITVGATKDIAVARRISTELVATLGAIKGQANFNARYDLNEDNIVDMEDVFIITPYITVE